MKHSHLTTLFVTFAVVVVAGLVFYSIGHARKSLAQDAEKSLNIERHANEPLELVEIKVSDQSVKNKINSKYRNGDEGREGADVVKFNDRDDWSKRVRVTLRNVSGKSIVGLQAYLYLKPPSLQVLFSITLKRSTQVERAVLEPGDEVEMAVDEGSWDRALNRLKQNGLDASMAAVTLSVENVLFSDGLLWDRGHLLQRDPLNPNRRNVIGTKSPPGVSRLNQPPFF